MVHSDNSIFSVASPELDQSNDKFRIAFESAPNAIIVADERGAITLLNEQAEQLFGYRRTDLPGSQVEVLFPERYRANHPHYRASFSKTHARRSMGAEVGLYGLLKDGSEVPIEIGLKPMRALTATCENRLNQNILLRLPGSWACIGCC